MNTGLGNYAPASQGLKMMLDADQPRIHRIAIALIHYSLSLRINCRYLR